MLLIICLSVSLSASIVSGRRVYQSFTRAVFEQSDNLGLLGGDAAQILGRHAPPASVHAVFVNFPEPAQQSGGLESQGKHILTQVSQSVSQLLSQLLSHCCVSCLFVCVCV